MNEPVPTKTTILVVEDDRDYSELIATVLEGHGHDVTRAFNIEDALTRVHERTPDLITLDLQMPRGQRQSGLHFYRRLKSDDRFRDVPIVVITGVMRNRREMQDLVWSFLEIDRVPPPNAYLDKPFDNRELIAVIEAILCRGEVRRCHHIH